MKKTSFNPVKVICYYCLSDKVIKRGYRVTDKDKNRHLHQCKNCGKWFTVCEGDASPHSKLNFKVCLEVLKNLRRWKSYKEIQRIIKKKFQLNISLGTISSLKKDPTLIYKKVQRGRGDIYNLVKNRLIWCGGLEHNMSKWAIQKSKDYNNNLKYMGKLIEGQINFESLLASDKVNKKYYDEDFLLALQYLRLVDKREIVFTGLFTKNKIDKWISDRIEDIAYVYIFVQWLDLNHEDICKLIPDCEKIRDFLFEDDDNFRWKQEEFHNSLELLFAVSFLWQPPFIVRKYATNYYFRFMYVSIYSLIVRPEDAKRFKLIMHLMKIPEV
ncbi:MAG: hypothetical protein ABII22_04690 [Candidatus Micrarchaeota archaeon]